VNSTRPDKARAGQMLDAIARLRDTPSREEIVSELKLQKQAITIKVGSK